MATRLSRGLREGLGHVRGLDPQAPRALCTSVQWVVVVLRVARMAAGQTRLLPGSGLRGVGRTRHLRGRHIGSWGPEWGECHRDVGSGKNPAGGVFWFLEEAHQWRGGGLP